MRNEKQFNALHPQLKRDLLVEKGVLIGKMGAGNDSVLLFHIDSLIAEVYFHRYRSDISTIIAYDDLSAYDKHIEFIKVEHLFQ